MSMKNREKLAGKILFINTAENDSLIADFDAEEKIGQVIIKNNSDLSEKLLFEINKMIKKAKVKIDGISVFPGPGLYTGLRVGITCANFLSLSFGVPLFSADCNGKIISPVNDFVLPIYFSDAKITKENPKV